VDIHLTAGRNRDALSEARRSLALARADGSQRAVGRALVGVGMALRQIGEVRRSLRWMERARRAALAAPDRPGEAFVAFQIACTLLELGRWDEALEAALTAIEQDQALHRERALHRSSAIALELAALRVATSHGHLFEDPTRQDTPAGRQSPRDFVATGIAQVVTDLLNGQIEPAMTLLREIEHRLRETPGWEYSLYAEVLPWTGRIASERGDLRELDRLARLYQSPPIDVGEAPVLLGEAALAAARRASGLQRSECASALAEFAASTFEASGYVFRAALARMELALALVHAGESERAADPLKNAYRQLSGIGATREVERLREALHSLNLRAPGPARPRAEDSLTRREDEVARLASRGLTNGQIASELDISARTVGTHMHRILKKLGLRSRHELRYLPDAEPDPIARLR
jgi:DNA-binding CsgD family transcriptional regulator